MVKIAKKETITLLDTCIDRYIFVTYNIGELKGDHILTRRAFHRRQQP